MPSRNQHAQDFGSRPRALAVHLALTQYPILGDKIRARMREMLFSRAAIDEADFEREVRDKAIESQEREGLSNPLGEESEEIWQKRLQQTRDLLTEFYFAVNLPHSRFLEVVEEILSDRSPNSVSLVSINPELAPWSMLFAQAKHLQEVPDEQKKLGAHQLRQIIVVLTKGMLSDQLPFVGIAKDTLTIDDLWWIYQHRIGRGKIGGKAAGMMLARSILDKAEPSDPVRFADIVSIPVSHFLCSDVHYEFLARNDMSAIVNFKYLPVDEARLEYPRLVERVLAGKIPERFVDQLRTLVEEAGSTPLIVRSSSLLEDSLGVSFAGKYDSYFCPNQGTVAENVDNLCDAIKRVYASVMAPDPITYRQQNGLIDYDERMGLLIQQVEGSVYGDYFFPTVAGVGFSHAPLSWNPRIDRDQGFLRIVAGMGTRAVDRLANDYAQMVALSHPTLRTTKSTRERIQYAQRYVDVINLKKNRLETRRTDEVFDTGYPHLRHIGCMEEGGELHPIHIAGPSTSRGRVVICFEALLKNRKFTDVMRALLAKLARHYGRSVDIELAVHFDPSSPVGFRITILQCRQQSRRIEHAASIPAELAAEDVVLSSRRMVSNGYVRGVRWVVYVDPEAYDTIGDPTVKVQLARTIGQLNKRFGGVEPYILVGPGRWGSSNIDLGVPVTYSDIFNARVLVEIALPRGDNPPEASYGTHFFQDLVESNIFALPVYPGEEDARVDYSFFRDGPNALAELLPDHAHLAGHLRVIDVPAVRGGRLLEVMMNETDNRAVALLVAPGDGAGPGAQ